MEKKKKTTRRSEEVQDIIDRMPVSFGRMVGAAVCLFFVLLMLFGWIIKYPDSVVGRIVINSDHVPVKLVAGSAGKIKLLGFAARDSVNENDYIAVIQNSASTNDVKNISRLLDGFNPTDAVTPDSKRAFPDKVSLGELNLKYFAFVSALTTLSDYMNENSFEEQRKQLLESIRWKESMVSENDSLTATIKSKQEIAAKWHSKYVELKDYFDEQSKTIAELETDRSLNDYLASVQDEQSLAKERLSLLMQIENDRNNLARLRVERNEKERQMRLDLISTYYDLKDNIKTWEQRYVFKAPFAGRVEFLKFLADEQFIISGEEVFGVVPPQSVVTGQMLLPSVGAGKVKENDRVIVQLDNYPYLEYGAVEGRVGSISLIANKQTNEQNTVNSYLITVVLAQGLTTNYGETLDFTYEIEGTANIVVNERRLIERLFDNLRYRTK